METLKDTMLVVFNGLLELIWPLMMLVTLVTTYPILAIWRVLRRLFTFPLSMQDKVVLITGASSGIGEHIAYEYSRLGAVLALVARRGEQLEAVAQKCRGFGCKDVLTIQSDMGDEEGCKKAVDETVQHFQRLDTLVLNAGLIQIFSFEEMGETQKVRAVMDVNFWGYVNTTKFALPHLRRSKGQIVVNDSVASYLPQLKNTIYNASKAAVSAFFETLRLELGSDVPITVFLPGVVKSDMTDGKAIQPSGEFATGDTAVRRRGEAGFGLFPVFPTPALARRAVAAARYRLQRVVIPSWYSLMFYIQAFEPELLQLQLWSQFSGKDSPVKKTTEALGGGLKAPKDFDFKEGRGYRKEE